MTILKLKTPFVPKGFIMVIVEVYGFSVMVINQWFDIKCTNIQRRKAPEYYYCEGCCS